MTEFEYKLKCENFGEKVMAYACTSYKDIKRTIYNTFKNNIADYDILRFKKYVEIQMINDLNFHTNVDIASQINTLIKNKFMGTNTIPFILSLAEEVNEQRQ